MHAAPVDVVGLTTRCCALTPRVAAARIWTRLRAAIGKRSACMAAVAVILMAGATGVNAGADRSETHTRSFPDGVEQPLPRTGTPERLTAALAPATQYGAIESELDDEHVVSRTTTIEGVVDTIHGLALIDAPDETDEYDFRGHPLRAPPRGASQVFYGVWPAAVIAAVLLYRRRGS